MRIRVVFASADGFVAGSHRWVNFLVAASLLATGGCVQSGGSRAEPPRPSSTTATSATTSTLPAAPSTIPATTPTTPANSSTSSVPVEPFQWRSVALPLETRSMMTGRSWRPGCPVTLAELRLVDLTYWGFDGTVHRGQLVVNTDSAGAVANAFGYLYKVRFPIRQMRLVDYFQADDEASMTADNTSAFNCRLVPGTTTWSQHSYGRAVDVDPLENPEVQGGQVDPPAAAMWVDRLLGLPGMIRHGDAAWRAFASVGWQWGGDWVSLKDYQHFSANGQ